MENEPFEKNFHREKPSLISTRLNQEKNMNFTVNESTIPFYEKTSVFGKKAQLFISFCLFFIKNFRLVSS